MPIVATPATPIILTVDQVRRFMRDYSSNNILLDDVEFSQEDINQGIEQITSAWNSLTPISNILPQQWPQGLQWLLLLGVAWYLMLSACFLQIRNQATYSDGDVLPIGLDDKYPLYSQFAQMLKADWDEKSKLVKTQLNLESSYGSLSSGYRNTSRSRYS